MLKRCSWPEPYWAEIPVLTDSATGTIQTVMFPMLLPREVFHNLVQANEKDMSAFQATTTNAVHLLPAVETWRRQFNVDPARMVPLGLHGDGVPFAAKMRDSLEQISWNLCAQPASQRLLFTAVPKSAVAGRQTWDALFTVFSWSMRHLMLGTFPSARHDGAPWIIKCQGAGLRGQWGCSDRSRAQQSGKPFSMVAALIQVRGDWAFYKSVFDFPSWSGRQICWCCNASRDGDCSFKDFSLQAGWRQRRYAKGEFWSLLRREGVRPSTLFQSPGLDMSHFMVDWLHTADLGVAADAIGNLFDEIVALLPGQTRKLRVGALWARIKTYYAETRPPAQLQGLTPEMIRVEQKAPKLRAKAAQCRYLIPFAAALAAEFADGSEHRRTVASVMAFLLDTCMCLSTVPYDADAAAIAARKFCLLYSSLEQEALRDGQPAKWRVKPKHHLFVELLEFTAPEAGSPALFWTYADESWGGVLAKAAARRGGPKFAAGCALNVISRFRARAQQWT